MALLIYGAMRDRSLSGWAWTVAVIGALFVVPNVLARINARIWIRGDDLRYRGILRVVRKCRVTDVQSVAFVKISVLGPRFPFTRILLLDRMGRTLVSIQEEWWSRGDIAELERILGAPVRCVDDAVTAGEANRRYPGAASFVLAHRFAVAAAVLVISVVALAEILQHA
ncbi:MAG: hypothetical protein ACREN2_00145 [Candidatus Dormibacteria bacterium]